MRVTESIGPAWETMKRLLFRPFNVGTWFSFGFIFFLQSCAEGGGSANIPNGLGDRSGSGGGGSGETNDAIGGALSHLGSAPHGPFGNIGSAEIVVIAVIAVIIAIPLFLLISWLGARGQMMAIRAVAYGDAGIGQAWSATQGPGMRMFKFHLAIAGITLAVLLPILGVGGALMLPVIRGSSHVDAFLVPLILLGGVFALALVPLIIVGSLARNFVAPIMLKHEIGAREGWKRFWAVGRNHVGGILVFFLLKALFSILAGIAGVLTLCTCCGVLPVIHQTLLAPWYVFERAWTIEILGSLDPQFDLRAPAPPQYPPGGGWGPPGGYGPPAGPPGYGPGGEYNPYAPPAGGFGGPT